MNTKQMLILIILLYVVFFLAIPSLSFSMIYWLSPSREHFLKNISEINPRYSLICWIIFINAIVGAIAPLIMYITYIQGKNKKARKFQSNNYEY